MSIEHFQNIRDGPLMKYLLYSQTIGEVVFVQSNYVEQIFHIEEQLLDKYVRDKSRNYRTIYLLKQQIQRCIERVRNFKTNQSNTKYIWHITLISDSIGIFCWNPEIDATKYIEDIKLLTQLNKEQFMKNNDNLNDHDYEWIQAWWQTFNEISDFILNFNQHNNCNETLPILLGDIPFVNRTFDHLSLFEQINKCENIVQILRRNRLYSTENETQQQNGGDIFVQNGNRWRIEHKKGDHNNLVIQTDNIDNIVYIYNCCDCTILIENTVNCIKMDACKKVSVVFKTILMEVVVLDCMNIKMHAFNNVPRIKFNTCNNIQLYITRKSLNIMIFTNQCYNIELLLPTNGEDDAHKKFTIPENLLTTIDRENGLITTVLNE